jgi:hypothetical protein
MFARVVASPTFSGPAGSTTNSRVSPGVRVTTTSFAGTPASATSVSAAVPASPISARARIVATSMTVTRPSSIIATCVPSPATTRLGTFMERVYRNQC